MKEWAKDAILVNLLVPVVPVFLVVLGAFLIDTLL